MSLLNQKEWILSCSVAKSHPTLCNPMDCSMPGFPVLHYVPEFAQTHVHPTISSSISSSPPALNLSQHQGLFQWVCSSHHQVAKVLELQLQHQSFQWILGLISFRIDWFDLLAVQDTLKGLFQHSLNGSVLQHSVFMVQLSHLYLATEKTIALTRWNFVSKVMSLLFNVLSRFIIAFLPRRKRFISWLQ